MDGAIGRHSESGECLDVVLSSTDLKPTEQPGGKVVHRQIGCSESGPVPRGRAKNGGFLGGIHVKMAQPVDVNFQFVT